MTDLVEDTAQSGSEQNEMHVNNQAPVNNQQNIGNYFASTPNPDQYLKAARRALDERRWTESCQYFADYLKHEPSTGNEEMAEVRVGRALAMLGGRRPRAHTDQVQSEINALLCRAQDLDPGSHAAAVLKAIFDEDLDHAFFHETDPSDESVRAGAELDLTWARRIVEAISVPESPTWLGLVERITPGTGKRPSVAPRPREEQAERERRMRTLFTPEPTKPVPGQRLNPAYGLLPLAVGCGVLAITFILLSTYGSPWWSPLSPAPYIGLVGLTMTSVGGWLTVRALLANWWRHQQFIRDTRAYWKDVEEYESNLPSEKQITSWFQHDVAVIVERALTRLGIVMEELRNTGRITDPLIIVGPANPPKTKLVSHPRVGSGYIASRYTVFVVCMADQKLGAYRTVLDAVTGTREPEEQTSEYRYRDIVSVNVKTVRLDLPPDAKKTDDAEPTYAFVHAEEKHTVAERFTLVVPGDRFTVTTKVSTDDGMKSRVDFSKADRALAAIRRRIAASTR